MERQFDDYKAIVNKHLLDFIPVIDNKSISLYDAMKYSLTAGGKRLRPVLLLAACAMDNDDLRRGLPTNHKVYGEALAILAGDGLLNTAFEAMTKDMMMYFDDPAQITKRVKAAYEIAKGAGVKGMVAGQVSDMESEESDISNEMLFYIHLNKTGALIKAAIKAGLYLGDPDSKMLERMDAYAENLGLSFQITDDILDVVGSAEELGKNVGQDEKDKKSTYTSINGLDKAYETLNEISDKALDAISDYYDNAEFFAKLINDLKNRTK